MPPGIKKIIKEYYPKNRSEWRQWLQKNHGKAAGIRLIIAKKESGLPILPLSDAVEEALCFGWIDSVANTLDEKRFKILFSPRNPKSKWSKINKERVKKLTKLRLLAPAGKHVIALAKKSGTWDALNEVDQLLLPKDLKTAFSKKQEGSPLI